MVVYLSIVNYLNFSIMQVAETILNQLGGHRFITMTGAKNFAAGENLLLMSIPRNQSKANKLRITLEGSDTYKMEFISVRGTSIKIKETIEGVYNDMLRTVFTQKTGLYTYL